MCSIQENLGLCAHNNEDPSQSSVKIPGGAGFGVRLSFVGSQDPSVVYVDVDAAKTAIRKRNRTDVCLFMAVEA